MHRLRRAPILLLIAALPWTLEWTGLDDQKQPVPGSVDANAVYCMTQVNEDGFGNFLNRYAWQMVEFQGELYVSTFNTITDGDFARGGPSLRGMADSQGGDIWRWNGSRWQQVMSRSFGYGNLAGEGVRSMVVHDGVLYAGMHSKNDRTSVWRSLDGTNWELISEPGLGDQDNQSIRAMYSWDGKLWVGTQNNTDGAEIWTWNGASWTLVADRGATNPHNLVVMQFHEHDGELYIGMHNDQDGGELLRYDPSTETFDVVVGVGGPTPGGYGNSDEGNIMALATFQGQLYTGTASFQGFQVRRSANHGASWENVTPTSSDELVVPYAWFFHIFEDELYLATFVGINLNPNFIQQAAVLWRTSDGANWTQEIGPEGRLAPEGIGDDFNAGFRTLATYQGRLHIGTAQCFYCDDWLVTGAEVWRINPTCEPPEGGCETVPVR